MQCTFGGPSREADELAEPLLVEADDHLPVDESDGGSHEPQLLQIVESSGVHAHIPLPE